MKHEKALNEIIDILFPKEISSMSDEEHRETIKEALSYMGKTKQDIDDDIETGIRNGVSVENQILLLKKIKERKIL